jgi:hypothetical protein
MNVRLHIERLVLEGIDLSPAERPLLQESLQAELGRLLAEGGIEGGLATGLMVPAVRANGFEMSREGGAVRLGQQIAGSVYGGIGE